MRWLPRWPSLAGVRGIELAGCAAVTGWAAALSIVDVRHRRLPNPLTLGGAVAILAGAAAGGRAGPALIGGVGLSALYLMIHLAAPAGMGAGDVKLAVGLGALTGALGPAVWALAALAAPLLTALAGVISVARGRGRTIAHGPSMCLASLAAAALAVL